MRKQQDRNISFVCIRYNEDISYPLGKSYSPDRIYPEYPFESLPLGQNHVYDLVRQCLVDSGADSEHYGSRNWNPLGQWINKGDRVFILPNLVAHRRPFESISDFHGKCTHGSVLRAVIDYTLIATGNPALIAFGNAPLQECDYERGVAESGVSQVSEFYRQNTGYYLGPFDLRAVTSRWALYGAALIERREQNTADCVSVDLGPDSLLDEHFQSSEKQVQVRVGDYDPRETMSYHAKGKHIYIINRRILEADVIISVPKLKTHQKVGITCALKGVVGAVARKECLAHHRKGGPREHGDEYPWTTIVHRVISDGLDVVNRSGTDLRTNVLRVPIKVFYRLLRVGRCGPWHGITGGSWYGNDTAWRMTLDIARILKFARPDGTLSDTPQRRHLAFIDGIIGGEGEGPLTPRARKAGVILFSPDACVVDYAAAMIMGFDPLKIPLILNGFSPMRYPVTDLQTPNLTFILNGHTTSPDALIQQLNFHFQPPKGWVGYIESRR